MAAVKTSDASWLRQWGVPILAIAGLTTLIFGGIFILDGTNSGYLILGCGVVLLALPVSPFIKQKMAKFRAAPAKRRTSPVKGSTTIGES